MTIDEIQTLVCLQLGVARVGPEDDLIADLGAESADLVNLVATVEDKYGIMIAEDELPDLRTVRDLYQRIRERG